MYQKTYIPTPISIQSIITVYRFLLADQFRKEDCHDFPELLYVEKGHLPILIEGKEHHLESGQAILHAPMARHQFICPASATICIVSFEYAGEAPIWFFGHIFTLTARQRQLLTQVVSDGLELFDRCWTQPGYQGIAPHPGVSAFELQQLRLNLELLLFDLYSGKSDLTSVRSRSNRENYKRKLFDQLTDYLKDHLGESLTLDQISRHCGISSTVLHRLCLEQCGCSPMAYFTSLKIIRAKRLIRESSLNFTQIAEELGFHTVHYFSKRFRAATGMTPSDYARSASSTPEH